jgi:hypothetical protein
MTIKPMTPGQAGIAQYRTSISKNDAGEGKQRKDLMHKDVG